MGKGLPLWADLLVYPMPEWNFVQALSIRQRIPDLGEPEILEIAEIDRGEARDPLLKQG